MLLHSPKSHTVSIDTIFVKAQLKILVVAPQEQFLAHQSVGNFACKVDSVEVSLDIAGDEDKTVIAAEDIESYLAQTATLEWAHVNQFHFSSLDGRNDEKNLGTGGGDLGEFIQGLYAVTKITGRRFSSEDVTKALERYLKIMSRNKFFYQTDEHSYRKLAIDTGCSNLKIESIGEKNKKKAILASFDKENMAEYIGDPFIRFLADFHTELEFPKEYISYGIQAYHNALWSFGLEKSKLCYYMVKGRSDPKALIHVKTPGYCIDQGLAPLISPQMCSGQVFIEHTDAVKLFRRELVQLLANEGENPQDILAEFNSIAQSNLAKFWESYVGLPTYTVTFKFSNPNLQPLESL